MNHTWNEIVELLSLMARVRHDEWRCGFPPFDSLPSEELEQVVDEWCLDLAGDLMGDLNPPKEVAQWILARIVSMLACAQEMSRTQSAPVPKLDVDTMVQFLVGEWHGALRDRWGMMVTLTLPEEP